MPEPQACDRERWRALQVQGQGRHCSHPTAPNHAEISSSIDSQLVFSTGVGSKEMCLPLIWLVTLPASPKKVSQWCGIIPAGRFRLMKWTSSYVPSHVQLLQLKEEPLFHVVVRLAFGFFGVVFWFSGFTHSFFDTEPLLYFREF